MANRTVSLKLIPEEILMSKIFFLRNEKVMLDKDLARLYGVKPIRLRQAVKRNLAKFPGHFMFQLTKTETEILVSQNVIPSKRQLGGAFPYAFIEHGVLMLANVLKSELAVKVSIRLIELFVKLRRSGNSNTELKLEIEIIKKKIDNTHKNIEIIFSYLDELSEKKKKPRKQIGFKLQKRN